MATTQGQVRFEWNVPDIADTAPKIVGGDLANLGRTFADPEWTLVRWDLTQSLYLEPLISRKAWENASTPESSTLAHELAISVKGQYTFSDHRLIPQMERVVGGLHTVRGYRESAAAADTSVVVNIEYRFHLPRMFKVEPDPANTPLFGQPFRFSPQQAYGRPDWDLVFRGFFDLGYTWNNNIQQQENDQTLVGVGGGVEFLFKQNVSVRFDWGVALHETLDETGNPDVTEGSNEMHLVATILF